jgi:zinc protease
MHRSLVTRPILAAAVTALVALGGPLPTTEAHAAPAKTKAEPGKIQTIKASAAGVELVVRHFVLANGLRVYVVEDHSTPSFAMHTAFRVGSRDEEEGKTGLAHFFEHMMYKGSESVPEGGHFDYVLGAGGRLNAFTTTDVTQYHQVLPSNYLDMALWLESDRLASLAMTPENFENQRQAVLEERAMRIENQPYAAALREFFAGIWTGSGYGHLTIGSKQDIESVTLDDARAFFERYYVPNNASMAIVGDVSTDVVKERVEHYFGNLPAGAPNTTEYDVDHAQKKVAKRTEDPLAQQPMFVIGWKTVPDAHPDRHALDILSRVLLDGESSRLRRLLVDEKKLAVATVPLSSVSAGGRDAGSMFAAFVPTPGKTLADIEPVVRAEVQAIKSKGISAKDLQKALNNITVETVGELATNNYRALMIAQSAALDDDPVDFLEDLARYQKVTTKDVKRVAERYLGDEWLVLEIVPKQSR